MQNDDILTSLSVIYSYARQLDEAGQGAASLGIQGCTTDYLIKYNLMNILSYLCTCSPESDLNINVISDIIGQPTTYADCRNSAANDNIDNSILTTLPLSFQVLVNADIANGVTSLENDSDAENSYAYTLFEIYQLIFIRLYNNCTIDDLKNKNVTLFNFLLGLQNFIQDSIRTCSTLQINPDTGTIDSNSFSVNPETGEVTIVPSGSIRSRTSSPTPRCVQRTTTSTTSRPSAPPPQTNSPPPTRRQNSSPSFFDGIINFFKDLFS